MTELTSPQRRPVVIAHRGASGYLPEHCLAGKAMAHACGADYLEQDVVATRDGVPIVFHDLSLDALTDVARRYPGRARRDGLNYCIDFELAEIRTLALRERIDPATGEARWPGRFPREAGAFHIPTLAEELAFIRGLNSATGREAGIYPEIKAPRWHREQGVDLSSAVLAELEAAGYLRAGERVFLQCFDPAELRRLRGELGTGTALIQLLPADPETAELDEIGHYARGIGPELGALADFTAPGRPATGLREAAARAGLLVHPYTARVDALPAGLAGFEELLDLLFGRLRVDGLFTDFPDLVRNYLDAHEPGGGFSRGPSGAASPGK